MAEIIEKCGHKYSSDIDGFNTCIQCGLVLSSQNFLEPQYENERKEIFGDKQKNIDRIKFEKKFRNDILLLKEMYSRDFFSYEVYQQSKILLRKWLDENQPFSKFHCAYSVYYASKMLNFPILMFQIILFLNIEFKDVYRLEKILPNKEIIQPSKYVNKFGGILNIPYKNIVLISEIADNLISKTNINPICLAICLLYNKISSLNIKTLSQISNISIPTIKKWNKILKNDEH